MLQALFVNIKRKDTHTLCISIFMKSISIIHNNSLETLCVNHLKAQVAVSFSNGDWTTLFSSFRDVISGEDKESNLAVKNAILNQVIPVFADRLANAICMNQKNMIYLEQNKSLISAAELVQQLDLWDLQNPDILNVAKISHRNLDELLPNIFASHLALFVDKKLCAYGFVSESFDAEKSPQAFLYSVVKEAKRYEAFRSFVNQIPFTEYNQELSIKAIQKQILSDMNTNDLKSMTSFSVEQTDDAPEEQEDTVER